MKNCSWSCFFHSCMAGILLVSCSREKDPITGLSEARYRVTVTGKWALPAFSLPPSAHFTTFVGMVHNGVESLWKENTPASPGMEMLAEIGNGTQLLSEIESKIASGNASALLLFLAPDATGTTNTSFYCNANFPQVSFASMIAPSPDWFVGVNNLHLYPNGKWITDTTVSLYPYDAGTEDGDVFGTNNPATVPQQNIQLLNPLRATVLANGNTNFGPIVTVRFTKQ